MKRRNLLLVIFGLAILGGCGENTHKRNRNDRISSIQYSHLSKEELNFAYNLSDIHRSVFCEKFTPSQRSKAMDLTKPQLMKRGTYGIAEQKSKMDSDESVERVLRRARSSGKSL